MGHGEGQEFALNTELIDLDVTQVALWADGAHIDRLVAQRLLFIEPSPGLAHRDLPQVFGAQQLCLAVTKRRQIVTHQKSEHHKGESQSRQDTQGFDRPKARGAQNGELGALCESRHHENGADQNCNGHELIDVTGHDQGHVGKGLGQ